MLLLTSCGADNGEMSKITGIPYQSEEDGHWGMLTAEGKVLFEEEFERTPTCVVGERFFVENKDGEWEIYAADEKPKQVGGDTYLQIAPFTEDVTPAVRKNKPVALIDRDGKEVKVLDKLDGKEVEGVGKFVEGLAVFKTTDGFFGIIDTEGNVVVKAEYALIKNFGESGYIAIDKRYKSAYQNDEVEKLKFAILSKNGEVDVELPGKKYKDVHLFGENGEYIAVQQGDGEDAKCGVLDRKGNVVLAPKSKIKNIWEVRNGLVCYSDGEKIGLMTLEGESVIRAKYNGISFATDDLLFVGKNNDDGWKVTLINTKDEQQGEFEGTSAFGVYGSGKYALVAFDEHDYGFIDMKGMPLKDFQTDVYDVNLNTGNSWVESDYVNFADVVAKLNLSKTGVAAFNINQTPEQAVQKAAPVDSNMRKAAEDYNYRNEINYTLDMGRLDANAQIVYGDVAEPITKTEYENYYGYTFKTEKIVGYKFTQEKPQGMVVTLILDGKLSGKGKDMFKAVCDKVKSLGTRIDGNDGALVVKLGNGHKMAAVLTDDAVRVYVIPEANEFSIDEYASSSASESDSFDSDVVSTDSVAVDTCAY